MALHRKARRRLPKRVKWLLLLAEVGVLVVVMVLLSRGSSAPPADVGQVPVAAVGTAAPPAVSRSAVVARSGSSRAGQVTGRPVSGQPQRLSIAAVDIDAPVVPVSVDAQGGLGVPDDVKTLGWWQDGAAPGSASGTVVIDGHVDSAVQGIGEFFRLEKSTPGDIVRLATTVGVLQYRVVARASYVKAELPTDVFARSGAPRLVLITCGGSFDKTTRNYSDNIVVYATPI